MLESAVASSSELPLSQGEVVAGLKDALSNDIARGAIKASSIDGYFANPRLKIEFPEDTRKVEDALRKLGFGKEVDQFVLQLNRGAEKAASRAKPIFIKAITSMTISDAFSILKGSPDAATQYLKRTTGDELRREFQSVVGNTLNDVNATKYYGDIVGRYNKIPLVDKVDPDLTRYATDRAIEGLFLLVAEEEANIRQNPRARTTQLLRRVFGSLD
ncbi:MAG: hypothetical protein ACI9LO_000390 [Planctomycetota bacterium]